MTRDSSGSALILAILVTFILALLGISFLLTTGTESRIAENERREAQTLYAAETGLRVVRHWFDAPGVALGFPPDAACDRSLRRVIDEDDPYGTPTPADGSAIPFYKQSIDRDGDGEDDLFSTPYRGDLRHKLLGADRWPDLRIDDSDPTSAASAFLADLSVKLFGPDPVGSRPRLRISRIELYAPPYLRGVSGWQRYGMATVRVAARLYPAIGNRRLAEHEVYGVLNEVPWAGPFGPLHSCGELALTGSPFAGRWGAVTAAGAAKLSLGALPDSWPRSLPASPLADALAPSDSTEFEALRDGPLAGLELSDPWVRLLVGERIDGAPAGPQPWPSADPLVAPDRSHVMQNFALARCPRFDYAEWKMIATSGIRDVHYYVWSGTDFLENGIPPGRTFQEWTDGARGMHFFDTADALPPRDQDGDGAADNLTPAIDLTSAVWNSKGFVFLNAAGLRLDLTPGDPLAVRPPGEPYLDGNGNLRHDAGEPWVNLSYPASAADGFTIEATASSGGSGVIRDERGVATTPIPVNFHGILYTSGRFEATGTATYYGSVIAGERITQDLVDGSLPVPQFIWDQSVRTEWPLPEMALPRVVYTRWSTGP